MANEKENFKKRRSIAYVNAAERLHRSANDRGSMYVPGEDLYYGKELPEIEVTSTRRGTGTSDTRHPVFENVSVPGWGINYSRSGYEQGRYTPVENVNPEFYTLAPALGVEDYLAGKAIGKGMSSVVNFVAPKIKNIATSITDYLPTSSRRVRYYGQRGKQDLILALNSDAYKARLMSDGFPFSENGYVSRRLAYPGYSIAKNDVQDFIDAQTKNILDTKVHTFYGPLSKGNLLGEIIYKYNVNGGQNHMYLNTMRRWTKDNDVVWNTAVHEATHAASGPGYFQSLFPMTIDNNFKFVADLENKTNNWSDKLDLSNADKYMRYLLIPDELRARLMTGFVSEFKNKNPITRDVNKLYEYFDKDYVNELARQIYRNGGRRSLEN